MRCCLKSVLGLVGGLLLLAALVLGGLYLYALPRLDRVLSDAVRREYMLAPSATVLIKHSNPLDTYKGTVDSFLVEAEEAKLEGLRIEDVRLLATGIQFDLPRTLITGDAELKQVEHAQLEFRVSEESLEERWSETLARRGISDVDVDLQGKDIIVTGKLDLKLTTVKVSARGNFEIDNAKQIEMKVNELSVGGASLGVSELKQYFSKSIRTPVIDLGEFKMGTKILRLEPSSGYLYVEAESDGLENLAEAMKKEAAEAAAAEDAEPASEGDESLGQRAEDELKDAGKQLEDLGGKLKDKIF